MNDSSDFLEDIERAFADLNDAMFGLSAVTNGLRDVAFDEPTPEEIAAARMALLEMSSELS